jgi:hypothetical protein
MRFQKAFFINSASSDTRKNIKKVSLRNLSLFLDFGESSAGALGKPLSREIRQILVLIGLELWPYCKNSRSKIKSFKTYNG